MARRAAHAQGGPRVVHVYGWGKDFLDIERVGSALPHGSGGTTFGVALARMHDAGAKISALLRPDMTAPAISAIAGSGADGDRRVDDPITYFAQGRLRPMVELGMRNAES